LATEFESEPLEEKAVPSEVNSGGDDKTFSTFYLRPKCIGGSRGRQLLNKKLSYRRDSAGRRSLCKIIQGHWFWHQSKARTQLYI